MTSKVKIPSFYKGEDGEPLKFEHEKHIRFFSFCLKMFPTFAQSEDNSRMMLAFFNISAMELLKIIETWDQSKKQEAIDWVYSHQIPNVKNMKGVDNINGLGFRGSSGLGHAYNNTIDIESTFNWDTSHIAMTYCSLLILIILGDDLSRVNRSGILKALGKLQLEDGSFSCISITGKDEEQFIYNEGDMRFVYCAAVITHVLDGHEYINVEKACNFIKRSLAYDGSFGQGHLEESHGGSTYCALASLKLWDRLDILSEEEKENTLRWCLYRQKSGFQGRPNKPEDTCYSFWIGASIEILGHFDKVQLLNNVLWLLSTQRPGGGFSKYAPEECRADPVHSYFGVCAFALMGEECLEELHPTLNISKRAAKNLENRKLNYDD